jgi:WD40 repeat protein/beta-lactamase regulating signal transducer with metallopeptidase domain
MQALLEIGLSNAVVAAALALVAGASRLLRKPALTHSLWLLVLLKLITPSLLAFPLGWPTSWELTERHPAPAESDLELTDSPGQEAVAEIPAVSPPAFSPATTAAPETDDLPALAAGPSAVPPNPVEDGVTRSAFALDTTHSFRWEAFLVALWLTGSTVWFLLALFSIVRFRHVLRYAQAAPVGIRRQAQELSQRLGLDHCPDIVLLPGAVSPMLWALGGRPRLLLPAELLQRLPPEQRATLLAHELAHLRRRDHWVRGLELLVTGFYWWHPVVWWARRELREAEEQCCDAWVLWALPASARTYADALLECVEFLSRNRHALPQTASGIGQVHFLRRRLTMIMRGTSPRALSAAGFLVVLACGACLLPLRPTWSQTPSPRRADEPQKEDSGAAGEDYEKLRSDRLRAIDQVKIQKAQLAAAEAALQQAEENLKQAYARWKDAKKRTTERPPAKRIGSDNGLATPQADDKRPPDRQRALSDRLAELEKKLDALREEIRLLRQSDQANVPLNYRKRLVYQGAYTEFSRALTGVNPVRSFQGHGLAVSSVAWSPDGKLALSGSYDTTVRLWDVATGKEIRRFQGHDAKVQSVAFSPDGRYGLSGGYDSNVILWELASGKELRRFHPQWPPELPGVNDFRNRIKSVAFSPDGHRIAAGGENGRIGIWETQTGKEPVNLQLGTGVQSVAFSPDGKLLAAGCFDGSVRLWDAASFKEIRRLGGHSGWVLHVAFSPDGRRLASSGEDGTVRYWDLGTGKVLSVHQAHKAKVECIAFSPDGRHLATASFDKNIRILKVDGEVREGGAYDAPPLHDSPVLSVAFSPDGRFLLSGGDDNVLRLWSLTQ